MTVGAIGSGLQGGWYMGAGALRGASLRVDVGAHNVANLLTDGFVPGRVDSVAVLGGGVESVVSTSGKTSGGSGLKVPSATDLPVEMLGLLLARHAFEAGIRSMQSQSKATGTLIEAFG